MTDPAPFLTYALDYAQRGWHVFPIEPRGKKPITPNGFKNASKNPDTIRRWWTQHPTANIGLACGASGVVVIDLDRNDTHDGPAEWLALLNRHNLRIDTAVSNTGGGGMHLLFAANGDGPVKNSQKKLAPGIDVRGDGGYIVLPPSIHPTGQPYEWANSEIKLAHLPAELVNLITAEPDPWAIYTLKDAFAPRPPLVWLVEGIVPASSLSIWYGAPGTLKSMLLADLCAAVASGQRWLTAPGKTGYAVTPAPVMWLDFDNGQRRTHERFAALARARKLPDTAPIFYASFPTPPLAAGDPESMEQLAVRLVDRGVKLIVIDNLGKVSGGLDENSADMQAPMDGLRWLAEHGLAVVVIHHQRKANGIGARAGEALRGHGSIEAALDLALLVNREDDDVTATSTKTRGVNVAPFKARFEYENDLSHELVTARFNPVDMAEEANAEEEAARKDITDYLTRHPYQSANAVVTFLGRNRKATLDLLRQMQFDGTIKTRPGPGTSLQLFVGQP